MSTYTYRGDKLTAPELKRQACTAVRDERGRCIRGRNGNMLVEFADGRRCVVLGRQLRKVATTASPNATAAPPYPTTLPGPTTTYDEPAPYHHA